MVFVVSFNFLLWVSGPWVDRHIITHENEEMQLGQKWWCVSSHSEVREREVDSLHVVDDTCSKWQCLWTVISLHYMLTKNCKLYFHYQALNKSDWHPPKALVYFQCIYCCVNVATLKCSRCHAQAFSTEAHSSHYPGHKRLISNWANTVKHIFLSSSQQSTNNLLIQQLV